MENKTVTGVFTSVGLRAFARGALVWAGEQYAGNHMFHGANVSSNCHAAWPALRMGSAHQRTTCAHICVCEDAA